MASYPLDFGNPPPILLQHGGAGLMNAGDLAMLQVAARRLRRLFPDRGIYVAARDPARLAELVPEATWISGDSLGLASGLRLLPAALTSRVPRLGLLETRFALAAPAGYWRCLQRKVHWLGRDPQARVRFQETAALMRAASHVVMAGGGYINDLFPHICEPVLRLLLFAGGCGKVIGGMGLQIGPLENPVVRELFRRSLPRLRVLGVRDPNESTALLRSLGAREDQWTVTGDDALELARDARQEVPGTRLGFNVRVASYSGAGRERFRALAAALNQWAGSHQRFIVPVPIAWGAEEDDLGMARALFAGGETFLPAGCESNSAAVLARVAECRVVLTGSYHAAVFALGQGIPVIGLCTNAYYSQKFRGLESLFPGHCRAIVLEPEGNPAPVIAEVEAAWAAAPSGKEACRRLADDQIGRGEALYRRLLENPPGEAASKQTRHG